MPAEATPAIAATIDSPSLSSPLRLQQADVEEKRTQATAECLRLEFCPDDGARVTQIRLSSLVIVPPVEVI